MKDLDKTIKAVKKEVSEMKKPLKLAEKLFMLLDEMSGSERSALKSRLSVVLTHLLKWDYQPEMRSNSWRSSTIEQVNQINDILDTSPSLKKMLLDKETVEVSYKRGLKVAVSDTQKKETDFPKSNPYNIREILNYDHSIFKVG